MKRRIALPCLALILAAAAANAGHVRETLSLAAGWNAVYLESTPPNPAPADFFAGYPQVERVGCYESSVFNATEQIAADGSTIAQKPAAYLVWERGFETESTLQRLLGGRCYMVYCTAPVEEISFYGVPAVPRTSWQDAATGFATIAGVSIPAGETVPAGVYFGEGPLEKVAAESPYAVGGTNAVAQTYAKVMAFHGKPSVAGGRAYAFEGARAADWPGVLAVSASTLSGGIAFGPGVALQSFSVANAGTTNRTIRVAYGESELAGETKPPLQIYIPRDGTNEYGWVAFSSHDFDLAAGASRTFPLAVDKSAFVPGATNAALVMVSDLSGTKMRVRVPVTAEPDEDTPASAAFPKGLWLGHVTLLQVDKQSDGAPIPAGGEMRATMLLHVDSAGAPHLLQRVAVGTAKEPDGKGAHEVRLWKDAEDVPSTHAARRLSAVFPDMAHRSLAATSGAFGDEVRFDWTVEAGAKDNPFRHAWHPDHGTGYAVTNTLVLSWWTEDREPTFGYNPDETAYGIATWTLGGLSGTGDVKARGVFALKRILDVSEIED